MRVLDLQKVVEEARKRHVITTMTQIVGLLYPNVLEKRKRSVYGQYIKRKKFFKLDWLIIIHEKLGIPYEDLIEKCTFDVEDTSE